MGRTSWLDRRSRVGRRDARRDGVDPGRCTRGEREGGGKKGEKEGDGDDGRAGGGAGVAEGW